MYQCPWCGTHSFSFWEKQSLGPQRTLQCVSCRRHVGVDWGRAQIAALPLLVFGFLGLVAGKVFFGHIPAVLLGAWLGITFGMLITAPLYHVFVPLVRPKG
jgi:hypothetical protein